MRKVKLVGEAALVSIDHALAKAYSVRHSCRETPAHVRMAALREAARRILARREAMARVIVAEGIKTIREARREIDRCCETLLLATEEARRLGGEAINFSQSPAGAGRVGWWERRPLGVVVGITPYNDPLNLVAHKLAAAVAAGAPVIIKPHPHTPASAQKLAEAFSGSGLPDGAIQITQGDNVEIQKLVSDAKVAVVSFTGGKQAGDAIAQHAYGKRLLLELGGVCVAAVAADADVARTADALVFGIVWAAGQNCVHTQRIYVQRDIFKQLSASISHRLQQLRREDPLSELADYGPLISDDHVSHVMARIADARRRGGIIITGGESFCRHVLPTLLTGFADDGRLVTEEIFAPVATIEPVEGMAEAEQRAARNGAMINAAISTNRLDTILSWHTAIDAGATIVNDSTDFRIDAMPFGGNGGAGLGREGIRFAIEAMTEPKLFCIRT